MAVATLLGRPYQAILDNQELMIRLTDVPKLKWLPGRRGGRRLNASTVFRWVQIGLSGVKLEAVKAGGALCTSEPAIHRFFERLSEPCLAPEAATPSELRRKHEAAKRELDALGI